MIRVALVALLLVGCAGQDRTECRLVCENCERIELECNTDKTVITEQSP